MDEAGAFFEDLSAKTPIECHFYNKGFCRYADRCTFLHIDKKIYPARDNKQSKKLAASTTMHASAKKQEDQSNNLCVFFFRGKCKAQSSCPFLHAYPSVEYARNTVDSKGSSVQINSTSQDVLLMETGESESPATPGKRKRTEIEAEISEDAPSTASPSKIAADVNSILDKYSTSKQIAAIAATTDIVIVKGRHKN